MNTPHPPAAPAPSDALRAEHDALAERLATRRSVDHVRRGAYAAFLTLVASGLTLKLAFDRWGSPLPREGVRAGLPLLFLLAAVFSAASLAVAVGSFAKARRTMREEDAGFSRLKALRARLGLDR